VNQWYYQLNKFLNPIRDGAVLPILNLNGYKINNPTLLARISHEELENLFKGYGWTPHFVEGNDTELMHQDIRGAERVIMRLSDLLRMTLENIGTQEVTLREEIDFVKGYLEIEQTRFHDRLRVEYDIAAETLDARVPNLLLQPLVENAIRHGIAKSSRGGLIQLRTEKKGDRVLVYVRDNGPGLKANGRSSAANFGIGLSTTRTRLDVLYPKEHTLILENRAEGGLEVRIDVPYRSSLVTEVTGEPLTIRPDPRPILKGCVHDSSSNCG
jgi:signal transduction histidine kinase